MKCLYYMCAFFFQATVQVQHAYETTGKNVILYFNFHVFARYTGWQNPELHGSKYSPNLTCS